MAYRLVLLTLALLCCMGLGCGGAPAPGTSDPEAKLRLETILELYHSYVDQKKKGPPNEQAFRDFVRQLPKEQKDALKLGEDLDRLFVSPRDGQKYLILFNLTIAPGGESQAVAWEQTGKEGKRLVALSMGYVQEYDEEGFKELKKAEPPKPKKK